MRATDHTAIRRLAPACAFALAAVLSACQTAPSASRDPERTQAGLSQASASTAVATEAAAAIKTGTVTETEIGAERTRLSLLESRTRGADQAAVEARQAQAAHGVGHELAVETAKDTARQAALEGAKEAAKEAAEEAAKEAAKEAERAATLERALQGLQGKNTQRGIVVTLADVLFASGQATLYPSAMRSVQQLAQLMQHFPARRVVVAGYTDNTGSELFNLELAQRRAEAFSQAMIEAGVAADRIDLQAPGPAYPVADNSTAAGRQANRRIEILFSDTQGRFAAAR